MMKTSLFHPAKPAFSNSGVTPVLLRRAPHLRPIAEDAKVSCGPPETAPRVDAARPLQLANDSSLRAIRLPEVLRKTGLSRSQTYRLEQAGEFPRRVKLGFRSSGWLVHEIDEWLARRMADRPS